MTNICPICQAERLKQARRKTPVSADTLATNRTRRVLAEHPDHPKEETDAR